MLKVHAEFDAALKHLTLALIDATTPASFSKLEIKFHIAHLYEVQGKYRLAKEHYEVLLKEKVLPSHLKADICRQLGKSVLSTNYSESAILSRIAQDKTQNKIIFIKILF
ncbi:Histone demethylase UTY [Camponotus floridanus]|uniref:Histone demethylase UTY n=1 Tax=Camponotus floridanus TaxID=104421 RepID=E1ZZ47_CAMFO|nr:Histone demethylase UTY [Camponotus floridanus]